MPAHAKFGWTLHTDGSLLSACFFCMFGIRISLAHAFCCDWSVKHWKGWSAVLLSPFPPLCRGGNRESGPASFCVFCWIEGWKYQPTREGDCEEKVGVREVKHTSSREEAGGGEGEDDVCVLPCLSVRKQLVFTSYSFSVSSEEGQVSGCVQGGVSTIWRITMSIQALAFNQLFWT